MNSKKKTQSGFDSRGFFYIRLDISTSKNQATLSSCWTQVQPFAIYAKNGLIQKWIWLYAELKLAIQLKGSEQNSPAVMFIKLYKAILNW